MDKPKIFVFTTSYYPFIGGAEIAIQEIAQRLAHEFDFFIVTSRLQRSLPRREMRPEGTVIRLGLGTRFDKWILPLGTLFHLRTVLSTVRRYRTKYGTDKHGYLLWAVDIGQGSLAAAAVKLVFPRIPLVLTLQYGESAERLEKGRWGLNRLGFRALLRSGDHVTAISTYLLDLARRFDYCGQAGVIHNGVDLQKFKIQNAKIKTTNQNLKCIVTVSRLVPKNGIDILIRAIAEVKKEIPNVRCLIIGEGPERDSYKLQITNYKLENNVELLGEIPHGKVAAFLHQADVFVRPSRSEGMGNAFVEALAAGLPIIGTPVGGITDIIEDGKTGLLARVDDPQDLAEKITRLLQDPELSKRIVGNGVRMVEERFSWGHIASAYVRVFQNVRAGLQLLIATPLFPPDIGGPATYSKLLVDELPQRGMGVRVIPFGLVRRLPKTLRHIAYFWRILSAGRGVDAIFAQDPVSVGLPAMLAAKLLGKKFLLKVVGDYAWEQGVQRFGVKELLDEFLEKRYDWRVELLRKIEGWVARSASKVIVPSRYLKKIVISWGIPEEKVVVIPNAPDLPETKISHKEARSGLALSGRVIVSAGRLVPWKGFEALIEIIPELKEKFPDIMLVIIGSGPEEKGLKEKAADLVTQGAIRFTGGIDHDEVLSYFRAGDVFVLNTGYEGMPHIVIEAMGMGIPIVTTRVGGNVEVVEDGVSGILVEYNNKKEMVEAIEKVLAVDKMRLTLSENARKRLGEFTKEKMVAQIVEML